MFVLRKTGAEKVRPPSMERLKRIPEAPAVSFSQTTKIFPAVSVATCGFAESAASAERSIGEERSYPHRSND